MAAYSEMEKENELAFLLNSLQDLNMGELAPHSNLRELIEDYFCNPLDLDVDKDSQSSEDEECSMGVDLTFTPKQASESASDTQTTPVQPEPGTSKGHDTTYDSDDEPFAPLQDLTATDRAPTTEAEAAAAAAVEENVRLCKCKLNDGEPCHTRYSREDIEFYRLQAIEMSREELDICILSKLWCTTTLTPHTKRSKQKHQTERKSQKTDYMLFNSRICRDLFKYIHAISQDKLNNLMKQFKSKGIEVRVHKSKRKMPKHALLFSERQNIVRFIVNYAEIHAITLPGRTPHHWRADVRLLPTNCTKKTVYDTYVTSCAASGVRVVAYRTFTRLWQELLPFITTMRPATDLCWTCQKTATLVARSKGMETLRSKAYAEMGKHLETVTKERSVYTTVCQEAKRSLPFGSQLGPHPVCEWDGSTHYSFDFAQQVHYPSNPLQPGPIFFKLPGSVVCLEFAVKLCLHR
ncbi:hypothetical protein EGW08_023532 [Elysia chlorotica]|uniref:Uncharacterized protein n=1 Tax=Elysia chlorotica TaxID=188477 RepID=A0A433SIG1_ELYCH|nr:hypothetical protein EGW08_023532 [Elysia chlorotica]